jgi:hypothetical protein
MIAIDTILQNSQQIRSVSACFTLGTMKNTKNLPLVSNNTILQNSQQIRSVSACFTFGTMKSTKNLP